MSVRINKDTTIDMMTGDIRIKGIMIPPPPRSSKYTRSISIINNKVYIDGYQLIKGKWKKNLRSLWHKYFK